MVLGFGALNDQGSQAKSSMEMILVVACSDASAHFRRNLARQGIPVVEQRTYALFKM